MAGKKEKFTILDLKQKVQTLETVFGEKFMRQGLNPRTVDKWLKEDCPTPYLTSLKKYFSAVGMKESDMIKSREAFSEKVADLYKQLRKGEEIQYTVEDVLVIYSSSTGIRKPGGELLGKTLKTLQIETCRNDYTYLKGFYHMYHYWKGADMTSAGMIRRNLIEIYDFDENQGLMKCRLMISPMKHITKKDWWIYEGWVFNIKNKLFWLFECVKGMLPEIVTFSIFKPSFWPEPDCFVLTGILTALSLEGVPCAGNMMLKKIKPDDPLIDKIGYFSLEVIQAEKHDVNIEMYINNKTDNPFDVLSIKKAQP